MNSSATVRPQRPTTTTMSSVFDRASDNIQSHPVDRTLGDDLGNRFPAVRNRNWAATKVIDGHAWIDA